MHCHKPRPITTLYHALSQIPPHYNTIYCDKPRPITTLYHALSQVPHHILSQAHPITTLTSFTVTLTTPLRSLLKISLVLPHFWQSCRYAAHHQVLPLLFIVITSPSSMTSRKAFCSLSVDLWLNISAWIIFSSIFSLSLAVARIFHTVHSAQSQYRTSVV